jgi:hypothetical protein
MLTAMDGDIDFKAGGMVKDVYIKAVKGNAETVFDADTKLAPGTYLDINAKGNLVMSNRSAFFKELNEKGSQITGSKEIYYKSTKENGPEMSVKAGKIVIR